MAALEALIRFALPLITDDDLLSILQMRLFDQQQTSSERLLHNEGVLEDLEQLDKDEAKTLRENFEKQETIAMGVLGEYKELVHRVRTAAVDSAKNPAQKKAAEAKMLRYGGRKYGLVMPLTNDMTDSDIE